MHRTTHDKIEPHNAEAIFCEAPWQQPEQSMTFPIVQHSKETHFKYRPSKNLQLLLPVRCQGIALYLPGEGTFVATKRQMFVTDK